MPIPLARSSILESPDGGQYKVPAWAVVLKDDDYPLDYNGNKITYPPPIEAEGAAPYRLPTPRPLGLYGSFVAFRMLEQDVVSFENYLQSQKDKIDPELLVAKFCGRWRSGAPLAAYPDQDEKIPLKEMNNFNYLKPPESKPNYKDTPKDTVNDLLGLRCPIGSHLRRMNPRNSPVDSDVSLHRIVRRGMPYGSMYDPQKNNNPDEERGLLGMFICASLESSFEFLMHNWINGGTFAPDIKGPNDNYGYPVGTKDAILGANDPKTSEFIIAKGPNYPDKTVVKGFPRFITTKGGAYCFLPSISGLAYIAES